MFAPPCFCSQTRNSLLRAFQIYRPLVVLIKTKQNRHQQKQLKGGRVSSGSQLESTTQSLAAGESWQRQRGDEASGHTAPTVRKERGRDADTQPASCCIICSRVPVYRTALPTSEADVFCTSFYFSPEHAMDPVTQEDVNKYSLANGRTFFNLNP